MNPALLAILSGTRTLAPAAVTVAPRDRQPVFTPIAQSTQRAPRYLPEMPEIEAHDMVLCDNNDESFVSFSVEQ